MDKRKSIQKTIDLFIKEELLGKRDNERLKMLGEHLDEQGRISRQRAIELTQATSKNPTRGYENFISKVNRAIEEHQEELEDSYLLEVFENFSLSTVREDLMISAKLPRSLHNTVKFNRRYDEKNFVSLEGEKKMIIFISYASKDLLYKNIFIERLERELTKNEITFELNIWEMKDIPIGVDFDQNIRDNLEICNYGLTLLSDNFIQSQYIMEIELPILLESEKIFPIGLVGSMSAIVSQIESIKKRKQKANAQELLKRNIFMLKNRVGRGDFFSSCSEKKDQKLFIKELLGSLEHRKVFDETQKKTLNCPVKEHKDYLVEAFGDFKGKDIEIKSHMEHVGDDQTPKSLSRSFSVDIQSDLLEWTTSTQAIYTLLGDFGMGKTFNLRIYASRLWERYREDSTTIFPFYIDLREIRTYIYHNEQRKIPSVEDMIEDILDKSDNRDFDVSEILQMHAKRALVLIFDGLDEKLTHYERQEEKRRFLNGLMSVVNTQPKSLTKTIFSCRNHYFETAIKQNHFLLGQSRENQQSRDFTALDILPLNKEDVERFLLKRLGKDEVKKLITYIESDAYLGSITSRPFMLTKIIEILPNLERLKQQKQSLNTSSFYQALVNDTLGRDEEKHTIRDRDKKFILKHLAFMMYREGVQRLHIDELNGWFLDLLADEKQLRHYNLDQSYKLEVDLRNSTLLVRFGEEDFGFSHSSIYEYFLSQYLLEHWEEVAGEKELSTLSRQFLLDIAVNLSKREKERLLPKLVESISGSNDYWVKLSLDLLSLLDLEIEDLEIKDNRLVEYKFSNLKIASLRLTNCDLYKSHFLNCHIEKFLAKESNLSESYFEDSTIKKIELKETPHQGITALESSIPFDAKDFQSSDTKTMQSIHYGHNASVNSVAFSPNGEQIVSGSRDNTLKLWNKEGECLATFEGHSGTVHSVCFSPNKEQIVSGSRDNTLKLWNKEGECLATFEGHSGTVHSVCFSPNKEEIVSGSDDNTLKLWSKEGECLATFEGHRSTVHSVCFNPNGEQIISGSRDTLKLWSREGECLATFEGHSSIVTSVCFNPNGDQIVSGSRDNTLKLWNKEGECLATFEGHSDWVTSVCFSPNGEEIVSGSDDNTLKLWSKEGECLATFKGHSDWVNSVCFSPNGKQILSGSEDNTLKLWGKKGECLATFKGHSHIVTSVCFSPNGEEIVSGSEDNTLKLWSREGECLATFEGHRGSVNSVCFSPNGDQIVSGSRDNTLKLWNKEGECLATFEGHSDWVTSVCFSPNGEEIVSGSEDNTLKLWGKKGECLATFKGHSRIVTSVCFSPNGEEIVSGSGDNTLKLWGKKGECLATFEGHSRIVSSVCFSPNGEQIVSGSDDNTLKLWSREGECLATFEGNSDWVSSVFKGLSQILRSKKKGYSNWVSSVCFSPNGKQIVSSADDNTLKLWSREGKFLATFKGHRGFVKSVSFSPNGKSIISSSDDGTMRIWDRESKEEIARYAHHAKEWYSLNFQNHTAKGTPMSWKLSTLIDKEGKPFTIDQMKSFEVYRY
jgi:WD40 repeat protein